MELPHYDYKTNEAFLDYEFYSEGPKGLIRKIVRFSLDVFSTFAYYNLAFGDWNETEGRIDDFVVSNNNDAEKVLATVAWIIFDFTRLFPSAIIYIEGSTPGRTRLYQMGIRRYWHDIKPAFDGYALIEEKGFLPFKPGANYNAFVITRKNQ